MTEPSSRVRVGRVSATVTLNRTGLQRQFAPIGRRHATRIGREVEREAKRLAPVRTGRLRASIHADPPRFVSPMLVSAPVTASAPYARYVHEGTRPHVIRASRGGALRFHWDKVGREVFFASVQHPGSRANPFMMTAARRVAARQH